MSGGSKSKVTMGYKYFVGVHAAICRGPVDAITALAFGDRTGWTGSQTTSGTINVTNPDLFGGEKREGGVEGQVDVLMGESSQTPNAYLQGKLGADIPAYRGLLSMVFRKGSSGFYWSAMNPYIKPVAPTVRRILKGWHNDSVWYSAKAAITRTDVAAGDSWEYQIVSNTVPPNPAVWSIPSSGYSIGPSPFGRTPTLSPAIPPATDWAPDNGLWIRKTFNALWDGTVTISGSVENAAYVYLDGVYLGGVNTSNSDIGAAAAFSFTVSAATGSHTLAIYALDETAVYGGTDNTYLTVTVGREGADMNPAHIIVQCLTDLEWGMGYSTSILGTSWTAAADQLYSEGFGLSLLWTQQTPIEDFVKQILRHIDGSVYLDRTTGKFEIKLHRDGYSTAGLPVFNPSNVVSIDNFQRAAWGETVNEITVEYTDPTVEDSATVTVQDLANIQIQGGVISETRSYPGIRSVGLAYRVAQRDLNAMSVAVAAVEMTVNRSAWSLKHGDVFKLTWPAYGLEDVIFRALNVDYGTFDSPTIKINAVEDVFALPTNTYGVGNASGWINPSTAPAVIADYKVVEATYYEVVRSFSAGDLAVLSGLEAFPIFLSSRPAEQNLSLIVYASPNTTLANFVPVITGLPTPSVDANGAVTYLQTAIPYDSAQELGVSGTVDVYAYWDNEAIQITNINTGTSTLTVVRGVLDTVPQEHADGSRIWLFNGEDGAYDGEFDFERTELSYFRLNGVSNNQEGTLSAAPQTSRTMTARWSKPWPPANVKIDTVLFPAVPIARYPVITWVGRNKLTQDIGFTGWTAGNVAPEATQTFTLEIYNHDTSALIVSATGLTLSGALGTYNMLTANSATKYRIELWSVLGGVASEYKFSLVCDVPLISFDAALLHFDGTNGSTTFTDASGKTWTVSDNAQISTAQYATLTGNAASGYFDGTGDFITSPVSDDFNFTGDFTVECWFRLDNLSATRGLWYLGDTASNNHRIQCEVLTNGVIEFYGASTGTVWWPTSAAGTIVANTWYHVACVRQGSTARLFVNGTQVASATTTGTPVTNKTLRIGTARVSSVQTYTFGYIDEFRVRKDDAVYTTNFTPPAAPFTYDPP